MKPTDGVPSGEDTERARMRARATIKGKQIQEEIESDQTESDETENDKSDSGKAKSKPNSAMKKGPKTLDRNSTVLEAWIPVTANFSDLEDQILSQIGRMRITEPPTLITFKQSFGNDEDYQSRKIRMAVHYKDADELIRRVTFKNKRRKTQDVMTFRKVAPRKDLEDTYFMRFHSRNIDGDKNELSTKIINDHFFSIKGIMATNYWQKGASYTIVFEFQTLQKLQKAMKAFKDMLSLGGDPIWGRRAYILDEYLKFETVKADSKYYYLITLLRSIITRTDTGANTYKPQNIRVIIHARWRARPSPEKDRPPL
jgi:hypothetical protein